MVYVHLVEKDIPASADEVWELLGPNFVDIVEWSTCHSHSRSLKEGEIPKKFHPSKNKAFIRNAPVLGRVVQNIFHGKGELAQTITMYVKARKELTYSCAFPLPIVDIYECTIIVNQQKDGNASVEMECCLYVVPGFCWLAELLGLRGRLRTDPKGPYGELQDIKAYFEKIKLMKDALYNIEKDDSTLS